MKNIYWLLSIILLVFALSSCNSFDNSNPSTALKSTANPPGDLPATSQATSLLATSPGVSSVFPLPNTGSSSGPASPLYSYPPANAKYVAKDTALIVRYGPVIPELVATNLSISMKGTKSGEHTGRIILADDHQTVIFKPDKMFAPGEQVQVEINSFRLNAQTVYNPLAYTFSVAADQQRGGPQLLSTPAAAPASAFPGYLTVPQDIPHYTVSKTSPDTGEGYIFVAPSYWGNPTIGSYLLILDSQGQLVYYQSVAHLQNAQDFKVQPNGLLSYYDTENSTVVWMDDHYQVVNTYPAQAGYLLDLHDSLLLPNGNLILMAYDKETVDMSQVVSGGKPDASVIGLVLLELDPSKNVVWVWRSWDHITFTDSTVDLTTQAIDLIHGNGLALANDGNLLLSSRNLSEITKVNLQTGEVIWRLGGKANMFKFVNDQGFAFQHNIMQLPNGNITLFDNHGTDQNPAPSRAVEYKVNETNKTVTKVWEFVHTPLVFTDFMGAVQRLADGNTIIGWGDAFTAPGFTRSSITEVTPDNQTLFDLTFDQPYVSYRAFRFPWQGDPLTKPALAYKQDGGSLTLGYSWNGATQVAAWRVYGGSSAKSLALIDSQTKNEFETQSHLANLPSGECYFQAAAVDKSGKEIARSPIISTDTKTCPSVQLNVPGVD